MEKTLFRTSMLMVLTIGLFMPPAAGAGMASLPAASGSLAATGAFPSGLLLPDGTLNLDGSFYGALNLNGWDVKLDAQRGPVIAPQAADAGAPESVASPARWADLGGGGGAVNGPVYAMAVMGDDVYIGGDFTDVDNVPAADGVARWHDGAWFALGADAGGDGPFDGYVNALAVSGTDLYVGGYFGDPSNGGEAVDAAHYVARWDTVGATWYALGDNGAGGPSLNNGVYSLATDALGNVYVGGEFTNVNNGGSPIPEADYVARWDGDGWYALGSGGAGVGSLGGYVGALVVDASGNVYAGGSFSNVNNKGTPLLAADRIAMWDGSDWSALGSDASGDGSIEGGVSALAISGSYLYVGGGFSNVANSDGPVNAADNVARWDGDAWSALGDNGTGNGALTGSVYALAVSGTTVYVGGDFQDVNNGGAVLGAADRIAAWNAGTGWSALGSDGSENGSLYNGQVMAIALIGSDVFAGGTFAGAKNGATLIGSAAKMASWNSVTGWAAMGGPQGAINAQVHAIAVQGSNIYVGGDFTDVVNHGTPIAEADYVAKWDGSNWSALGTDGWGDGCLSSPVYALALNGSDLYVGGMFTNVVQDTVVLSEAERIAKWNGSQWSALGNDGHNQGSLSGSVEAIAVDASGNLYVGGFFSNVNNYGTEIPEADYVAMWNGANWSSLGNSGTGFAAVTNYVKALAAIGTDVYVGGSFTNVRNGATTLGEADYVAKWNGTTWSALGSDGAGGGALDSEVDAIAVRGSNVYVGGYFSHAHNGLSEVSSACYIATWDGASWSSLGSDGSEGCSLNHRVLAIATNGAYVFAGGAFTDVNDGGLVLHTADYVAAWDGTHWLPPTGDGADGGSINSPSSAEVQALGVGVNDLYVGGYFFNVNNHGSVLPDADHIAAYGLASKARADFNADGKTEVSVFRPSSRGWFARSVGSTVYGLAGDIPIPADFDGNGDSDVSVFRPSDLSWYAQGHFSTVYGQAGDVPLPRDYDGNGKAEVAVYRPSTSAWYVKNVLATVYGVTGDIPIPSDYDGNGTTDIAVYRPSTSGWFVRGQFSLIYGLPGDIPVPADYNGDGITEIAVYRPSTSGWYIRNVSATIYGVAGDVPVPGDYDGNGTTDIAVYRPASSAWYVKDQLATVYGLVGDYPLPAPDTNADGDPYH